MAALVVAAGCVGSRGPGRERSSTPPAATPAVPGSGASLLVNAEVGGVVALDDEVSLSIPPGSLAEDTTISIERISDAPVGDSDGMTGFGQAYRFLPAGLHFAQDLPATMTMRYDGVALAARGLDGGRVQMAYFDETMGRYLNVANHADGALGTITARVEHFTVYMPVAAAAIAQGNPPPIVALQNSVPFPIRAGAPIYVRYTVRDQDPVNANLGYTGGAIRGVKLYYRKLQTASPTVVTADMVREPVVDPTYGATIEDTYGARIPETFLTAADLGPGPDIEYCAIAIDNLGATTPAPLPPPAAMPCVATPFDVTATYQPGSLTVNAPTTAPITAGYSRTFRVRGSDASGFFPIVPALASISVTRDMSQPVGEVTVSPSNATFLFKAEKQDIAAVTVFMGMDSSTNAVIVTNGAIDAIQVRDTNGAAIAAPLTVPGRSTYAFDVRGVDELGNVIDVAPVTWTADPQLGAIDVVTGVLTAGNTAATGLVTATLGGPGGPGGLTATATVTVVPRYQVIAHVTGLVGTATLTNNGGDPLTVSVNGSYAFATLLGDQGAFDVAASVQPVLGACHGAAGRITGTDTTVEVKCYRLIGNAVANALTTSQIGLTLAGSQNAAAGFVDAFGGAARFNSPQGISSDGRYLYVADNVNRAIRRVRLETGQVTTLAGGGMAGAADGVGTAARFQSPRLTTSDGTFVYVSDDTLVRKIRIATGEVTTLAGLAGAHDSVDGIGPAARFDQPAGLACDGPNLYVVDASRFVVRKIVLATGAVSTLAGDPGASGATDGTGVLGRFAAPWGLTTDGTWLYVADSGARSIRRVNRSTGDVLTIAGTGASGRVDGPGSTAAFFQPFDIVSDGTTLYVSDVGGSVAYIRRIDVATFTVGTVAGGSVGFSEGSNPAFGNGFYLASDGGKLVIADTQHNAIRTYFCAGDCSVTPPPLSFSTCTSPGSCLIPTNFAVGFCQTLPFSIQFVAQGGFPPYTWSTDSIFPPNFGLFASTGLFSVPNAGPVQLGICISVFSVCVRDSLGAQFCHTAQVN